MFNKLRNEGAKQSQRKQVHDVAHKVELEARGTAINSARFVIKKSERQQYYPFFLFLFFCYFLPGGLFGWFIVQFRFVDKNIGVATAT